MQEQQGEMGGFTANLAAMDELIDFAVVAAQGDATCTRQDLSKGGRPPCPTKAMVPLVSIRLLHSLSDEDCEYQVLDRMRPS